MRSACPSWRALVLAYVFALWIEPTGATAGCNAGSFCEDDDSSLLQGSRVSKGKERHYIDLYPSSEKESVKHQPIELQSIHGEASSWASLQHSEMPRAPRQPSEQELKEADKQMAEHPLVWWKTLLIFFTFVFGICLIMVLILGCLELGINKANRLQADLINQHKQERSENDASASQDALREERSDVVKEITADDVKQMVNGDQRRLARLLELADSPAKADTLRALVEKAAKANKLRLSADSIKQTCAGLEALAKAAKKMQSKSAGSQNLKPKQRLQHAMKQVLWMVKIRRALKIPIDKEHREKAICDNEAQKGHHADKYAEGHRDSLHGGYKDVKLGQSAMSAYFASEKYVDHLAMGFVVLWSQVCALVYAMYLKNRFPKMYAFMGPWLLVSRGEAMAAIVVTMLMVMLLSRGMITTFRKSLSWSTVLAAIVDKNVLIHKWCGMLLVVYAILHVIGHLRGSIPAIVGETDTSKINAAFTYGTKIKFNFNTWGGALQCWPAVTGYLLLLILIGFWALSNEKVRRKSFELFHYPHLILIILWCGTLIAHGWKQWLGVGIPLGAIGVAPIILYYFVERLLNIRAGHDETIRISDAVVKKRNVLLTIDTGNTGFQYETGHYCMLKVPEISAFQWHPFTIASGGGQRKFQVLFAVVGDWTTRLSELLVAAQKEKKAYPRICVRGGYGAPAEGMKNKKHIVMVGGGVGATPFLSFLSNLCNSAQSDAPDAFGGVETAVFYWVSREPEDFMWINKYSAIIETTPRLKNRVSVRLCMTKSLETAATEDCSATEVAMFWLGVQVALSKFNAKSLASELGAPTQFGRPNWKKEFADIANKLLAKSRKVLDEQIEVSVFACGNQMLVASLEEACDATDNLSDCIDFRLYAEEF